MVNKSILVTGSSGLIGGEVVNFFSEDLMYSGLIII